MFHKPLVISDNPSIFEDFITITSEVLPNIIFDVGISEFSDPNEFVNANSIKIFNLKRDEDIKLIIENYDIVISLHCKQLFPPKLVENCKCINIHPGYNPINRGWYPQVFAIIQDLEIGATIHEITNELDNGPIIAREKVNKYSWDTSLSLYNRVLDKEMALVRKNIKHIISDDYETFTPNESDNLFLKSDFENLKEINLNKRATYKEVINHLRALSHGDYKNAFFVDSNGNKIFLKVDLEKEVGEEN